MKIRTLLMALAAFSFMLTACENKANKEQNTENQTETVAEEDDETLPTFTADDVNHIGAIHSAWEEVPFQVPVVEGMSDLKRVANTFCFEYGNYDPNTVLHNALEDPNYNDEDYAIESQEENGYLACKGRFQYSKDVCCRMWDRENGHKLVAFWLEEAHEDGEENCLLAFYDFDPATNTMTPEPALSNKVDEAMAQYDGYTVRLQDQEIIGHKINVEEDNCENTVYLIRWNGNDFSLEKTEE